MPSRVYELAPIAALIGSIYALAQLASHSEFTVMRASGFSTRAALGVILRLGAGIMLLTIFFGELVAPNAERLSIQVKAQALGSGIDSSFKTGQWLRDTYRAGNVTEIRFVNFGEFGSDGMLNGLEVYQLDAQGRLRSVMLAKKAQFVDDDQWLLTQVSLHEYPEDIVKNGQPPRYTVLPEMRWGSSLTPELLSGLYVMPERMSAVQLWRYKSFLQENRQRVDDIELALAKKLVFPLAVLVMMVIALPFAYIQVRAGGLSLRIFIGIMMGIGFHLMNNLFSHLSMIAQMPPLLSASLPTLIALAGGLGALWWVSRVH